MGGKKNLKRSGSFTKPFEMGMAVSPLLVDRGTPGLRRTRAKAFTACYKHTALSELEATTIDLMRKRHRNIFRLRPQPEPHQTVQTDRL